jgi:hypothetical protein
MELIFADPYYDSWEEWEPDRFVAELKRDLEEFDQNVVVIRADIGRGADWPVVLVELFHSIDGPKVAAAAGPISLYFLGDRIKKNGEAWLEMARMLKRIFSKRRPTRIDEKVALFMVIEELAAQGVPITQAEISVQVIPLVTIPYGKRTLDRRPEAVYVVTVGLDGRSYLFAVESNGNVACSMHFAEPMLRF